MTVIRDDLEHALREAIRRRDKYLAKRSPTSAGAWARRIDALLDQWLAASLPTRRPRRR